MAKVNIAGVSVEVLKGDITKLDVGAIVNVANSYLTMFGGVAGAIGRVGGQSIEDEAVKDARVPMGKAVATSAAVVVH